MWISFSLIYFLDPKQSEGINPLHGVSSEGYKGKGFVQSEPSPRDISPVEEE